MRLPVGWVSRDRNADCNAPTQVKTRGNRVFFCYIGNKSLAPGRSNLQIGRMRNGLLLIGWLGFTTLASAEEAARAGHVTLDVWRQLPKEAFIHLLQPDEVAGLRGETTEHSVVPIDNLGLDTGRCTVRARCVVTAPQDGYYQFSLEAWGTQLVMLSDDATPARLRPLWRSSRLRQAVNYGPWRYFRKDQPRYLEIRHVYTQDSAPMTLGWTLSDGTKQSIPASCVTSYPVGPDDAKTDDGPNTEGRFAPLLKDKPGGSAITLDLKAAKALTDGYPYIHCSERKSPTRILLFF